MVKEKPDVLERIFYFSYIPAHRNYCFSAFIFKIVLCHYDLLKCIGFICTVPEVRRARVKL